MSKGYRALIVWQKAMVLVDVAYRETANVPSDERFGLTSQIRRAAVSIAANIAEGHGRATRGEYCNHLSIARGSLKEFETLCEIAQRQNLLAKGILAQIDVLCDEISRMLTSLRRSLSP